MSYDINTNAINLGACKIWYWDTTDWVSVGATSGGAIVRYTPTMLDIKIDQTGETVVKKMLQGELASLEFGIAESGFDKLQLAIPFGTIYSSGGDESFNVGRNAGADLLDYMLKLKVHPINTRGTGGVDDETYIDDDFTIWKAGNANAVEIPFGSDSARVYRVTMDMYPDFDQTAGRYLFVIGDTSISADADAPGINGILPADGATNVAIDSDIVLVTDEQIRETSDGVPNGQFGLIKTSDHSNIAASVSSDSPITGTADSATATTLVDATLPNKDDIFNGLYIEITSGTGAGDDLVAITDYTGSTGTITVAAWANGTPDATSTYKIHATLVTINPTSNLSNSTEYNVIAASMVDLAGNVQGQDEIFESSFTTIAP